MDTEGHEFFEAPSIRKVGDVYFRIFFGCHARALLCHEPIPHEGFEYQGVIVSNNDLHIDSYKPADKPMYYGGNNHGGMAEINGKWYIFYHRHTNGTNFCRQGCMEEIKILSDGSIPQVEMSSCGSNNGPLRGHGEYPAYIACNLFCKDDAIYTGDPWMDGRFPKITQDGRDGDEEIGYIANMRNTATAGFKYFDCKNIRKVKIKVRGYCRGAFEIKTSWNGPALGRIPVDFTNVWTEYEGNIAIPDGVQALYFTYTGSGGASLASFTLE